MVTLPQQSQEPGSEMKEELGGPVCKARFGLYRFETTIGEAIEYKGFNRNAIDIMLVFSKMARLRATEVFSVDPFVMLGIDGGWSKKLTRIRLLNWKWKTRNLLSRSGQIGGRGLGSQREGQSGDRNLEERAGKVTGKP